MPGKYFDDLAVGQRFRHANGRTVTETDNVLFCGLTMNPQPLHLNEDFAKKTQFGRRIMNGIFTMGLVVGLTVPELTEGTIVANLSYDRVAHPAPLFALEPEKRIAFAIHRVHVRAGRVAVRLLVPAGWNL